MIEQPRTQLNGEPERIVPRLEADEITAQAVVELREGRLHSRFWHTRFGEWLLKEFWMSSVGLRTAKRFNDAVTEELHGYAFWGPVILAILVTEILGTGWLTNWFKSEWPWHTISSTVGHLEDLESLVGVAVVIVIAGTVFYAVTYASPSRPTSEGRTEFTFTLGSLTRRYGWPVVIAITAVVGIVGYFAFSLDPYPLSYAIYASFAVLAILVPLFLVLLKRHVVFPSLPYTLNCLRGRFPPVLVIVVAGLSVLVIHLSLYPWPDIARQPSSFAGVTAFKARDKAEAAVKNLHSPLDLSYSTQDRDIVNGQDAWSVYFSEKKGDNSEFNGCVVTVDAKKASPSAECK